MTDQVNLPSGQKLGTIQSLTLLSLWKSSVPDGTTLAEVK